MEILRERNGQALLRFEDFQLDSNNTIVRYEWWCNTEKMKQRMQIEEKNDKTYIHCYVFYGKDKEIWLIEEFDRRVPKYKVV